MKKLTTITTFFLAISLALFSTSCTDDEKKEESNNENTQQSVKKRLVKCTTILREFRDGVEETYFQQNMSEEYQYDIEGRVVKEMASNKEGNGYFSTCIQDLTYYQDSISVVRKRVDKDGESISHPSISLDNNGYYKGYVDSKGYLLYELTNTIYWDDYSMELVWENGIVTKEFYKFYDKIEDVYTYIYETEGGKTIPNKGNLYLPCYDITIHYPYLGKANKLLPIKKITSEGRDETYTYDWTLDSDGYPIKCIMRIDRSNTHEDITKEYTYNYVWEQY